MVKRAPVVAALVWAPSGASMIEAAARGEGAEASSRPVHLVLLGDSITANYELKGPELLRDYNSVRHRYYAPRYALNVGFAGNGKRHLWWRIIHHEIDTIASKVAVILIRQTTSPGCTAPAGIDAVVAELHLRSQGT